MKYLITILSFILLCCCSDNLPDSINTKLDDDHFRIKGTKLFVKNLEGFQYLPDINLFKYSDSVYIHCLYADVNFSEKYKERQFDFYHNKDFQIISKQDFKINGLDGVYYKLKEGKSYWLYFIFGDTLVENRIVATYPDDNSFEAIIYDFVKSVYYKPDYILNPIETAKFDVDFSNSDYKFVSYSMNSFIFYQDSYAPDIRPNGIYFSQTPPMNDTSQLKLTLEKILSNLSNNGMLLDNVTIRTNEILDSNISYVAEINGSFENKAFYNRTVVASSDQMGLIINATLYNDIEKNKIQFDSILQSVRF